MDVEAGFKGMLEGLGSRVGKDGWGGGAVVDGLILLVGSSVVLAPDAGLAFSLTFLVSAHCNSFDFSQFLMEDLSLNK